MAQSYTYTTDQINEMLNIGYDIMKHATSEVQNCTFPNAAIIDGMKAGKSPEEIASDAYNSIIKLDPIMDGYRTVDTYNSVAHPFHNAAQLMAGEIITKLKAFAAANASNNTPEPTYTYTIVSNPTGNPKELGYYEKNGDNYTLTNDTEVVSEKDYYVREEV